jgi:ATP-dependent RNA helicase HelY
MSRGPGFRCTAQGGELAEVLPDDVVAGDFVRLTKQTVDLVRQVATVAPHAETRETAQEAHRRLARGIIAVSSSLEPA